MNTDKKDRLSAVDSKEMKGYLQQITQKLVDSKEIKQILAVA